MESGEDHLRTSLGTPRRFLDVNETSQDVHPRVTGPDPLPKISSTVPVGVGRIARPEIVALIERQETSPMPGQMSGHRHRGRIDREMHHPHPTQRAILRVPALAVLGYRMLHVLAGQRILQLGRRHRDTVHEQAQVNGSVARRLIAKLAGHRQHVRPVQRPPTPASTHEPA